MVEGVKVLDLGWVDLSESQHSWPDITCHAHFLFCCHGQYIYTYGTHPSSPLPTQPTPNYIDTDVPYYLYYLLSICCENLQAKNFSPRRGIEPRSPAWQAGILATILSRTTTLCCNRTSSHICSWTWPDLNWRLSGLESDALPTELHIQHNCMEKK